MYEESNYTSRTTTTKMLVRLIVHNAVGMDGVDFDWITPGVLKMRVAWPECFQMAEQMAAFTLNDNGEMLFPPEHPPTMDTSERNQALVEEDNRIWDSGVLTFDQDMKTDTPVCKRAVDSRHSVEGDSCQRTVL